MIWNPGSRTGTRPAVPVCRGWIWDHVFRRNAQGRATVHRNRVSSLLSIVLTHQRLHPQTFQDHHLREALRTVPWTGRHPSRRKKKRKERLTMKSILITRGPPLHHHRQGDGPMWPERDTKDGSVVGEKAHVREGMI